MQVESLKQLKQNLLPNHAIIGFDFGEKRLGVAVSDLLLMTANSLKIIYRKDFTQDLSAIKQIISDYNIGAIIYGLPLQMNGIEGSTTALTKEFAQKLDKELNIPYFFWDERLSSRAVENFLIKEVDMSRNKRKKILDASAAAYILQGALDSLSYL